MRTFVQDHHNKHFLTCVYMMLLVVAINELFSICKADQNLHASYFPQLLLHYHVSVWIQLHVHTSKISHAFYLQNDHAIISNKIHGKKNVWIGGNGGFMSGQTETNYPWKKHELNIVNPQ